MGFNSAFKGLMILEFSWQIFEKSSNIKLHENPGSGNRVVPCWQTDRHDMTNLTVAFRNFENAPKERDESALLVLFDTDSFRTTDWTEWLRVRLPSIPYYDRPLYFPAKAKLLNPYYTKPSSSTLFIKLGSSEDPMVFFFFLVISQLFDAVD